MRTISWRWHHEVVGFQCMIHLESLLVVRSVHGQTLLNRLARNLKLLGQPLKMRGGGGLPGKAASRISFRVDFHHIQFNFSVDMQSCFSNVFMSRCYWGLACEIWPGKIFNCGWGLEPDLTEEGDCRETFGSSFRTPSLPRKIPFVPVLIGAAPC